MSETQYIQPGGKFDLTYTQVPPSNFGEAYAKGIASAGQSMADMITKVGGEYQQNRDVDDTLKAMNQSKMLKDDDYQAVAGKSLGAKQTLLGMHASKWIADAAMQRTQGLQASQGLVDINTERAKLADRVAAIKQGNAAAAGVDTKKMPISPVTQQAVPAPAPTQSDTNATPTAGAPIVPMEQGPVGHGLLTVKPGVAKDPKSGKVVSVWRHPDGSVTLRPPGT